VTPPLARHHFGFSILDFGLAQTPKDQFRAVSGEFTIPNFAMEILDCGWTKGSTRLPRDQLPISAIQNPKSKI
jgi:hypothetical protein